MLLGGCTATQASGTAAPSARIESSKLLSAGDIGPGWMSAAIDNSTVQPCSSPPSVTSIVGPEGVGSRLVGPGGSPELVEYAATSTSVTNAYITAISRLQNQSSCSRTTDGHTSTGVFDQVLALPTYGDGSVAMLLSDDMDGALSQAGYVVVRRGHELMVVGYINSGPLDTAALQGYTRAALVKLDG